MALSPAFFTECGPAQCPKLFKFTLAFVTCRKAEKMFAISAWYHTTHVRKQKTVQ
jgi:hypothetical protein